MRCSAGLAVGRLWLGVAVFLLPGGRERPVQGYRPAAVVSTLPGIGAGEVAVAEREPTFWQTWRFQAACVAALLLAGWAVHRRRVVELTRRLNLRSDERLAERTRIAQELYDTLLQGFLSASMQLHLAVDTLAEGSPERERLDRVLRVMGQVTEEGRIVLQGLRSADGEGEAPSPVRWKETRE